MIFINMTKEERSSYNKAYNEKNKEKILLRKKQFYQSNKKRLTKIQTEYNKTHYAEMRAYQRAYYRLKCYGLDKATFDKMLCDQHGKCGICGMVFDLNAKITSPHVDHNHITGKVRSLLCHKCNLGLGYFLEKPEVLIKAAEYIKYHAL